MKDILSSIKNKFNDINKQKITFLVGVIVVMILIIVVISISTKAVNKKTSYVELEKKLITASQKYMNDYPSNLPTKDKPVATINDTSLIENKYIKKFSRYVRDESCNAEVKVYYNDGSYNYQAFLNCKEYKTEKLSDILKSHNKISSFGEGLYEMNEELVYRGENPNNYLKFAEELWRIVKINKDEQIIIIKNYLDSEHTDETEYGYWDDRYNTEGESQKGINNFAVSRALANIRDIYQTKYSKYQEFLSNFNICAAKRSEVDASKDGSIECSNIIEKQYIGLLPVYDFLNASLDSTCLTTINEECQNYNYLVNEDDHWWTATGDTKNTFDVYYVNYNGYIESDEAAMGANYRYVLALNKNILFKSGEGTLEEPYEIR